MAKRKFIKSAIKHPGVLRRFAEQHHFIKKGKIDLVKVHNYGTKHHSSLLLKRVHLAATLRKLRLGKCPDCPKG